MHSHRGCLEVHFRERGEQTFQVADRLYQVRGGELFVNQPDETHSTGGHPCGPGVMYCLLVRLPRPRHGLLRLSPEESRRLVKRFEQLPDRQFRAHRDVKRLFDGLIRLHDCPETFLHKSRMRLTAVMLLMRILDSADRDTRSQTSAQMAQVIQTIREHPENDFRLEEWARQTHLSLARFKGRFKAETGVSPWQFILQTKIQAAQQRLRAGDRSVTDIALDLGFVSSQYFATVFKRLTGLTPRAYRRGASSQGQSIREDDGQS